MWQCGAATRSHGHTRCTDEQTPCMHVTCKGCDAFPFSVTQDASAQPAACYRALHGCACMHTAAGRMDGSKPTYVRNTHSLVRILSYPMSHGQLAFADRFALIAMSQPEYPCVCCIQT